MKFVGKTAIITGGAQGLGLELARAFASEGGAVGILDIDAERGASAAANLTKGGAAVAFAPCDVADEDSVQSAVGRLSRSIGDADILVNGAAFHLSYYNQPCTRLPRDDWRKLLEVNVIGIVNCSAACADGMSRRGGGVIVNVSSIASFTLAGAYGVSKLAVRGLTVSLAQELAPQGIRVCGVAPGLIDTPSAVADVAADHAQRLVEHSQLIKRPGRMADVVAAVFFLASPESSFVTGETLIVGGGFPLRA
jgi:NAD(P)-dependent dehydrogenase (short-subunit alcohol dehydrogenase family)